MDTDHGPGRGEKLKLSEKVATPRDRFAHPFARFFPRIRALGEGKR